MHEMILFATGLAAVQIIPVFLHHNNENEALQIEEAFLISMFMLLNTPAIIGSVILSVVFSHLVLDKPWYKMLFNVFNAAVSVGISGIVAHSVGGLTGAVIGAIFYTVITAINVAVLFKFLKAGFYLELTTRFIMVSSAVVLGIFMFSMPAYMPFVAMATVGTQMFFQLTTTKELATVYV